MQQYAGVYLNTAKLLYMFRVSAAAIIRNTSNCNRSFWYRSQYMSNNLPPTWPIGHIGGRLLIIFYDLYQKLQLRFDVFLMMAATDTRNMQSNFAEYKHLHTVASCWILLIQSHDVQNHEYKKEERICKRAVDYQLMG